MTQTMSVVSFQGELTKVLTTTYKSGVVSKRYLDAQTGLPFHVEWIKPKHLMSEVMFNIEKPFSI